LSLAYKPVEDLKSGIPHDVYSNPSVPMLLKMSEGTHGDSCTGENHDPLGCAYERYGIVDGVVIL
jgi:hypothetical protein